ncbi:hypothetical protein HQ447_14020 [bacterium]|nr:hypothetical protein [bacterium]
MSAAHDIAARRSTHVQRFMLQDSFYSTPVGNLQATASPGISTKRHAP